ncbi:lethal(3)malignant brain tumor-like protein 1 [Lates japonicus]|uniref:Lethal(3)malignant brain tumor-like protein 1 n=1 Tax=Lates japonicus TaxID=270547 RepID=A0AAD3M230_LATJO|nr:lethal(3)malignant brain tumor-like protein 1 [Lates japonicus]
MIDGEAFLLLTQTDIVKIMSIKLGPALKISNAILMFKSTDEGLKLPAHTDHLIPCTQHLVPYKPVLPAPPDPWAVILRSVKHSC